MRITILAAAAAAVALSLSACSTINVRPDDYAQRSAPAVLAQKAPAKVALAVPAQFATYHHVGSPESLSGSLRTFDFELGRPMAEALRKRLGSAFTLVPDGQAADFTITPAFERFRFTLDDDDQIAKGAAMGIFGHLSSNPSAITDIGMRLEAVDSAGRPVTVVRTNGRGVSRDNALSFGMEREFTLSAGAAINETSTKAVQALIDDPVFQTKLTEVGRR